MRNTTRVRGIRGKDSLCAALAIIMRGENVKNCALLRWAKPALARSRTTEKLSLESWLSAELETKPSPFDLFRANSSEFNRGASRICRTNKLIKLQFIDHAKFDAHRFESTAIGNPKKNYRDYSTINRRHLFHIIHDPPCGEAGGSRATPTHRSINIATKEAFIRSFEFRTQ